MEDEDRVQHTASSSQKSKTVIKIPSFQEVIESSHSKSTPPSLFAPSKTFSQAFAFVKSSEFYSPPPPPPPSTTPQNPPETSNSRETGQSDVPAIAVASSSSVQRRNAILVSNRQKGNPLLKHIRNVRWEFADIICDYLLGQNSCALYLSLRYHLLHPGYLYYRIKELPKKYKLWVVLCHVDVEDVVKPLLEVTKTAMLHECTLLCAWSLEECGRYLETIKVYENKPADIIQGQMYTEYLSWVLLYLRSTDQMFLHERQIILSQLLYNYCALYDVHLYEFTGLKLVYLMLKLNLALTTVRHVNKIDVVTLGTTFGSLSHVMDASMEDLARCPGIGERKVKRLHDTFHEPFKRVVASRPAVPESSHPGNAEPLSVTEDKDKKDTREESKRRNKEPEPTVKSTLSAAFAKYADRVKKKKSPQLKNGDASVVMEGEPEKEKL